MVPVILHTDKMMYYKTLRRPGIISWLWHKFQDYGQISEPQFLHMFKKKKGDRVDLTFKVSPRSLILRVSIPSSDV